MRFTIGILSVLVLLTAVGTAGDRLVGIGGDKTAGDRMWAQAGHFAQDPGEFGRGMGPGGGPPMDKMRSHVEQLRILKLLELLDLGEDQELEFLAAFSRLQRDTRALDDSLGNLIEQLGSGLRDSSLTASQITSLIDDIDDIESAKRDRATRFKKEAGPLLTAEQQGKVVVFRYRFEEELLRQVRAFRDRGGRGRPQQSDSLEFEGKGR